MFMKLHLFSFSLSILLLWGIQKTKAQTCCSGGVPLSNNIGLPTLQKGSWQFGLSYDYNNLNTLKIGSKKIDDDIRLRVTHSVLLNVGYSISEKLSVEMLLSWVNQRRAISQLGNVNLDETSGIGDAILLGRYLLLDNETNSFSIGMGTKLPFGSSTNKNNQGILLNADLQPGSNTFDYIMMSTYSKRVNFRKSMNFSGRITYRATGTNHSYLGSSDYKFGNEFQTFVGVSDQFFILNNLFNSSITFKYRNAIKDKINNIQIENTGGNWIFIIPSVSFYITSQLLFTSNIELPIYANVQGTQLTPTYRINTGILFQFTKKTPIKTLL